MILRIIFILLVVSHHSAFGQKSNKKFPFQILLAKGAYNKNKEVNTLDHFKRSDRVEVTSGKLIMVHYSGRFFEFEGDTSISIANLEMAINTIPKNYFRPDINILYSRKFSSSLIIEGNYPIKLVSPHRNMLEVLNQNLCISWISENDSQYTVEIKNAFSELIKTYNSDSKSLSIDLREIGERLIIVRVRDKNSPNIMSREYGVRIVDGPIGISNNTCIIESPYQALMIGFYLEQNLKFDEAHNFYLQATELSQDTLIRNFLENFLDRHPNLNPLQH